MLFIAPRYQNPIITKLFTILESFYFQFLWHNYEWSSSTIEHRCTLKNIDQIVRSADLFRTYIGPVQAILLHRLSAGVLQAATCPSVLQSILLAAQ